MPERFKVTKSDADLEDKDPESSPTDKFIESPTSPGKIQFLTFFFYQIRFNLNNHKIFNYEFSYQYALVKIL